MRLTSTGLGIGTSSPAYKLSVVNASGVTCNLEKSNGASLQFTAAGVTDAQIAGNSAGALVFYTGSSLAERMRLDSSGNLGLGVTPSAWGTYAKALQFGYGAIDCNISVGYMRMLNNAYESSTNAFNYQTTNAAAMYSQNLGSHGWYTAPSGTAGNAITFTQAMTLDTSGNLLVGTTSAFGSPGVTIAAVGVVQAERNNICLVLNRTSSDGDIAVFRRSGTQVGSVSVTTVATLYNTTSDQRLKTNIQDAEDAATLIDAIQVRQYDWKSDGSHQRYGFIAQELVTVAPEAVHQPADPDEMMAVDYSKLVPMMVKEIQSLRKRLTALEGKA
jgi:hypothetical protein